jgi:hypothetical protein
MKIEIGLRNLEQKILAKNKRIQNKLFVIVDKTTPCYNNF